MYSVKNYIAFQDLVLQTNYGHQLGIYYKQKLSLMSETYYDEKEASKKKVLGNVVINNEQIADKVIEKRNYFVSSQIVVINYISIKKSLNSIFLLDKMDEKEWRVFKKALNDIPKCTAQEVSERLNIPKEQVVKMFNYKAVDNEEPNYSIIQFYVIHDYPPVVKFLQYVRKQVPPEQTILMNAYIMDINETVQEYLEQPENKGQWKNLDSVYLQLFVRAIKNIIDYDCLNGLRPLMEKLIEAYDQKKYMECFNIQRMIFWNLQSVLK